MSNFEIASFWLLNGNDGTMFAVYEPLIQVLTYLLEQHEAHKLTSSQAHTHTRTVNER
jgi:hypothetical protein